MTSFPYTLAHPVTTDSSSSRATVAAENQAVRLLNVLVACVGLVVLAPLMAIVAALVKLSARPDLDYETRALILDTIPGSLPAGYADRLLDDEARRRASPQTLALLLSHFRRAKREAEVALLTREILARAKRGDQGTHWGTPGARRWV